LNARLMRVEVISLRDDVFYGNLVVENNGRTIEIDSRPSDALALAVRARVPILVSSEVMDSAGIVPEQDIQAQDAVGSSSAAAAASSDEVVEEESEERLSVFEDFLQNLELDETSDNDEEEDDEDPDRPARG